MIRMKEYIKKIIINNSFFCRLYFNLFHILCLLRYFFNYRYANPKIDYMRINKVIFVAHPDDEILSMGNFLFNNCDGLLVICMTNGGNRIRLKEFTSLMKDLNIQYQIWNFKDGLYVKWNEKKVLKKIEKVIQKKNYWEIVLTHNQQGEYGHFLHKEVHRLVRSIYRGPNLYVPINRESLVADKYLLKAEESDTKIKIFEKYYLSQLHILDSFKDYFMYESIRRED